MQPANFFSSGSPYLSHPLLTPERTAMEIDFILSRFRLREGARILDVGCGTGRHSLELAKRGYKVVGIDPSAAMIAAARSKASVNDPIPEFIRARGEDLTTTQSFDASICLFTTLGQMADEQDNHALIKRVYEVLRPGGTFAVEIPNREWVRRNLKTNERFGNETHYTQVTRHYEPEGHFVEEVFNVTTPQSEQIYLLRYRIYNQDELLKLLKETGFQIFETYGGYDGAPLEADSPLMIVFAHNPEPSEL